MRIFVGNLSYSTTEDQLADLFAEVGQVESATIVTDRDTGRSRGFAFVESESEAANKAIAKFNGYELNGRTINVNEARPRPERGNYGGGGGRGGYGGGRGQRREPRWEQGSIRGVGGLNKKAGEVISGLRAFHNRNLFHSRIPAPLNISSRLAFNSIPGIH